MTDFIYPNQIVLQQVAQELVPRLAANRAIFDIMPMRDVDSDILEWEQMDNYIGLQQVRGLNGDPGRVVRTGAKRYLMVPGAYGEFALIDERELTKRRPFGTLEGAIDVTDLVRMEQDRLLQRRLDRIESIGWTLVATGTFAVAQDNSVLHTDSFTTQTYAAGVAWATSATATPLADIRAVQLKSRGYSVDFGARAKLYVNRGTMNAILSNTNAADLYGRRGAGLSTVNSPQQLNELLAMDDLPNFVVYDDGYYDDTGTFRLFIPNNKAILVGARRDGDPVAEYRFTKNANNPGMASGAYMKIVDDQNRVPRSIEIHDGHNGGPVLYHPAAIVVMTV